MPRAKIYVVRPVREAGSTERQSEPVYYRDLTVLGSPVPVHDKTAANGALVPVTEDAVRKALRTVKDPEIDLDLVVLGLIYEIEVEENDVKVWMSLTSPMCPVAEEIVNQATEAVKGVEGVENAEVQLTFDPPWTADRIAPLIRSSLGL